MSCRSQSQLEHDINQELAAIGSQRCFDLSSGLETDDWLSLLWEIISLLVPKDLLVKALKGESNIGTKEGMKRILRVLHITVDMQVFEGDNYDERLAFARHLLDITKRVQLEKVSPRVVKEGASTLGLLSTSCKTLPILQSKETSLFQTADLQRMAPHSSKANGTLAEHTARLRADFTTASAELLKLPKHDTDESVLMTAQTKYEHSLGAYVARTAEFQIAYAQDMAPWVRDVQIPEKPIAKQDLQSLDSNFNRLSQVLASASQLFTACQSHEIRSQQAESDNAFMTKQMQNIGGLVRDMSLRV